MLIAFAQHHVPYPFDDVSAICRSDEGELPCHRVNGYPRWRVHPLIALARQLFVSMFH